jgi:hypothetical protein
MPSTVADRDAPRPAGPRGALPARRWVEVAERHRGPLCALAAVVGTATVLLAFHPGYMSNDSIAQLTQARAGAIGGMHSPVMTWVWRQVDGLLPGPAGMLLLQNAIFWAGLALLAASKPCALSPVYILAVGLCPPLVAQLATVWKDVHMVAGLVLAAGSLAATARWRTRSTHVLAAVGLFYAAAARPNGIVAAVPVALWWGLLFPNAWSRVARKGLGLGAGALLAAALVVAVSGANRAIVATGPPAASKGVDGDAGPGAAAVRPLDPASPRSRFQSTYVHDLVGISVATGVPQLPPEILLAPGMPSAEQLAQCYSPSFVDPLYFGPCRVPGFSDPRLVDALRDRWVEAVREHPTVWLGNHLVMFRVMMGFATPRPYYPYHYGIDDNALGIRHGHHAFNRLATRVLSSWRNSVLFRPWIWLVAQLGLVAWATITRRATAGTGALVASSIAHLIPYFFITPAPDFRYAWWVVVATCCVPFTIGWRRASPEPREAIATA